MKRDMINKRRQISDMLGSILMKYNLRIDDQPTALKARVLRSPVIYFKNSDTSARNGCVVAPRIMLLYCLGLVIYLVV